MVEVGVKFLKKMVVEGTAADQLALNMLIMECCKTGELGKAFDLLNVMNKLDINTYNAIITGLNRVSAFQESHSVVHDIMGDLQGAFKLRDEMEALQVSPCDVAESAMVRGLALCGKVEEAMLVLNCMLRMRLVPTVATFMTLMYKFCKEANFVEVLKLKGIMEHFGVKLDVVAYNVLISGLCAHGDVMAAFELYEEIKQRGLWPNTTTYTVLIDAISKEENFVKGELLLKDLQERKMISWDWDGSTQHLHEGLMIVLQKLKTFSRRRKK
ncbi:hypothetical protein Pint_03827 [Pistacia integerrima]|uniref:Uncharacterized protein n=1 Tax=Pistacia integerrima TaxID=434235 RepID=A0ACC0Z3D6_9ROSI|nr:hypothetical protein Pint_03827 [Pistacia integerrima]